MTQADLTRIFSAPGLYILRDSRLPGTTCPIVVLTSTTMIDGKSITHHRAFSICIGPELSADIANWESNKETSLAGGPYSLQTIERAEKGLSE